MENQRQTAIKCTIATLQSGAYIKQEGWSPNYISSEAGDISRAHLVGVVVESISEQEFILDDSTGRMSVRTFETTGEQPTMGSLIRVIGRPREYQGQRYLIPEIVRPIHNPLWAKLHKQETKDQANIPKKENTPKPPANSLVEESIIEEPVSVREAAGITPYKAPEEKTSVENIPEETPKQEAIPGGQDPHTIIYALIKKLDVGHGADYEEVIQKSSLGNGEQIIEGLMKEGEIFLIAPGKLKVLE